MDAKVIEAIAHLVQVAGVWGSFAIVGVLAIAPALLARFVSKHKDKAHADIVNDKERQIQRLADENREWRNYFFRQRGLTDTDIAALSGPSAAAKPILAGKPGAAEGHMQPPPDSDMHEKQGGGGSEKPAAMQMKKKGDQS